MKLRIAAAREGIDWLRSGARAFARQPVALIGLPLMLAALLAFAGMLPLAGPLLALALLPAGTVGLMEAARQATQGRFPSPAVLLTELRTAPQGARQILLLGLLYALCGAAVQGLTRLLLGEPPDMTALQELTAEKLADPALMAQARTALRYNLGQLLLFAPLSLAFWHAPALTHWHGVPPVKSLFFSVVAVLHNWRAFTLYGLASAALLAGTTLALTVLLALLGAPALAAHGVLLLGLAMAAIFSASVWFSFCGCFEGAQEAADAS